MLVAMVRLAGLAEAEAEALKLLAQMQMLAMVAMAVLPLQALFLEVQRNMQVAEVVVGITEQLLLGLVAAAVLATAVMAVA
jgi:hypothetical protein